EIEPEVDLPRCRLVAPSRTGSRLHGGRTPRSAESGTRTCDSVGLANTRSQPESVLRRRDHAHAPTPAAPASLRCSLHPRTPTLLAPPDRCFWQTRSAPPSG